MYLKIADFVFKIILPPTKDLYKKFAIEKDIKAYYTGFIMRGSSRKSDIIIEFENEDKFLYIKKGKKTYVELFEKNINKIKIKYSISIFHFNIIMMLILQDLLKKYGGIILHASSNLINNRVYLFLAPNKTGKSTVSNFLSDKFKKITDDITIVRKIQKSYYAYQTPFIEKPPIILKSYKKFKLGGLIFLEKGKEFNLKKIKIQEALYKLSSQVIINSSEDKNAKAKFIKTDLILLKNLKNNIYVLSFPDYKKKLMDVLSTLLKI